ncbi:MAG: hypothetical protein HRU15_04475 [Planctomycetes bacterium]|nr:hypothetical protein [Planctomycetota bacterium]
MSKYFLLCGLLLAALCISSCIVPDTLLGPTDEYDLLSDPWKGVYVVYWIRSDKRKVKREFEIKDSKIIDTLRLKLNVDEVKPNATGVATNHSRIELVNGEEYHCSFLFPKQLRYARASDNSFSYISELKDSEMFNALIELCVVNELSHNKGVTKDHIILATFRGDDTYLKIP